MFFSAALQGKNEWWRYLLGILLVFVGYVGGQMPLLIVVSYNNHGEDVRAFSETMDFSQVGISSNLGFFLALLMFVGASMALYLVVERLHHRPFRSLIQPLGRIRWSRFFYGLGVWMLLGLLAEGIYASMYPEKYTFQFRPEGFFPLMVIAIVLIPLQASFEEWFVRGYLMQGLALLTRHRLAAVVLSSLFFAGLHLANPEIQEFGLGLMVTYYTAVALFLAVITVMDDGLELAMGIHTATNLFGSLFLTFEGSAMQTEALFLLDTPDALMMLIAVLLSMLLFYLWASRRFGWAGWKKLTEPLFVLPSDPIDISKEQ